MTLTEKQVAMLIDALRAVAMNDKTAYEHHEKRRQDSKRPETAGGTIWLSPREIALETLKSIGEEVDSLFWPFEKPTVQP